MPKDPTEQAVILTLRKRPSVRRRAQSEFIMGENASSGSALAPSISTETSGSGNPWQERRSSAPLSHRLSFDPASGVINLPDDADWLGEEEDVDSDEDYGTQTGGLENSVASLSDIAVPTTNGDETVLGSPISSSPTTPSRLSRYGTYFHHPERRRQVIPGAFPR